MTDYKLRIMTTFEEVCNVLEFLIEEIEDHAEDDGEEFKFLVQAWKAMDTSKSEFRGEFYPEEDE